MNKRRMTAIVGLAIAIAATTAVIVGTASADGRQLTGTFCTNAQAMPKPGACISLAFDGQTAQGYTGSQERTMTLRPGTYWLTANDNSTAHNFSLESPDGSDQELTPVADAPGSVTVEVHLTPGAWVLFCAPHRPMGMYVDIEVGGVGQVG
jgi:plastocyanin